MACYHPIRAYWSKRPNLDTGNHFLVFNPNKSRTTDYFTVPCGKCEGCLLDRAFAWSVRCTCESYYHRENYFLTLTYDKAHLPSDRQLNRVHVQQFIKRLRKHFSGYKLRFFYCGEYGESRHRPHYHMIVFGLPLSEKDYRLFPHSVSKKGHINYVNPKISQLWYYGLCTIGSFSSSSAAYVAQYTLKKNKTNFRYSSFSRSDLKKLGLVPPFVGMSNRPGIAQSFFDEFWPSIFRSNGFNFSLSEKSLFVRPLRFFVRKLRDLHPLAHFKYVVLPSRSRTDSFRLLYLNHPDKIASLVDKKSRNLYIKEQRTLRKLEARLDL